MVTIPHIQRRLLQVDIPQTPSLLSTTPLFPISFVIATSDNRLIGIQWLPLKLVWEVLCDSDGTWGAVLGAKKLDCLEQKVINPCGSQSDLGLVDVGALGCVALAESEDELVGA